MDGRCCHGHNTPIQSARSAETKARSPFEPLRPSQKHAQRSCNISTKQKEPIIRHLCTKHRPKVL